MKLHERIALRNEQKRRKEDRLNRIYEWWIVDMKWTKQLILASWILPYAFIIGLIWLNT